MDSSNYALGANRASRLNKTLYSLPVHCLTADDLKNENAKGIMQHFHAPENEHNRFLASLTQQERAILRHIERPLPYNYKASKPGWNATTCPTTAPGPDVMLVSSARRGSDSSSSSSSRRAAGSLQSKQQRPMSAGHSTDTQQFGSNTTQKGVPCYGMSMIMDVDLMTGQPASAHICSTQPWRVAKVKTHAVPSSSYGYGEGGKRAQHQTYGFYKYYGFAGKGAKTSWASSATKVPAKAAPAH